VHACAATPSVPRWVANSSALDTSANETTLLAAQAPLDRSAAVASAGVTTATEASPTSSAAGEPFRVTARVFASPHSCVSCDASRRFVASAALQHALSYRPHVAVLVLGAYDAEAAACHGGSAWDEHFRAALQALVQALQRHGDVQHVVVIVPPLREPRRALFDNDEAGAADGCGANVPAAMRDRVAPAIRAVVRELGLATVDVAESWASVMAFQRWRRAHESTAPAQTAASPFGRTSANVSLVDAISMGYLDLDGVSPTARGHGDIAIRVTRALCSARRSLP
jgi:hypothetical protein